MSIDDGAGRRGDTAPKTSAGASLPLLSLDDVRMAYGERVVLERTTAELRSGTFVCMIGANGSGKSTLLRALAGLQKPRGGAVVLKGRPLYGRGALPAMERARSVAVVLTEAVQTGYLTVRQLVHLGRTPYEAIGSTEEKDREAVEWAYEQTGIADLDDSTVSTLSDGQKQRVMIARALAQDPDLLLLDEPGSFLDPPHQVDLFAHLRELTKNTPGMSVVVATHSIELALQFAHQTWLFSNRGLAVGAPEEIADPEIMERAFAHPKTIFDPKALRFVPGVRDNR